MIDINKLLGQLLGSGASSGVTGGLASGLASMMSGKVGSKLSGKALKPEGLATVGALAYTACQRYSEQRSTSSTPQGTQVSAPVGLTPAPAGSAFMPKDNDAAAK